MIKIKREKGITLIALILTIIIALILASIAISVGTTDIDYSKMVNFLAYMQTIQKKVDLISLYGDYQNLGSNLTNDQKSTLNYIITNSDEVLRTTANSETLKYFNKTTIASQLEIENVDDEIVVDFATREVISLLGIEYNEQMYYTQYNLPGGQALVQDSNVEDTPSFDSITPNIDGLNATFTISGINITNGTLSYSTDKTKWAVVTNYTIENEDTITGNITKSGTYYFKLTSNVTGRDNGVAGGTPETIDYPSITILLTNKPTLNEDLEMISESYDYSDLEDQTNWAYAKNINNSNLEYIWIPRFAYDTGDSTNIVFLRGTSEITTDGSYITSADWTVPQQFKIGNIELTGVWVSTNSYNTNDIMNILQNGEILR